jgi:hypothetical protein
MNVMKAGKNFLQYTLEEQAWMKLSNHPCYQSYLLTETAILEECKMLEVMSEDERQEYFKDMEETGDEEWW